MFYHDRFKNINRPMRNQGWPEFTEGLHYIWKSTNNVVNQIHSQDKIARFFLVINSIFEKTYIHIMLVRYWTQNKKWWCIIDHIKYVRTLSTKNMNTNKKVAYPILVKLLLHLLQILPLLHLHYPTKSE